MDENYIKDKIESSIPKTSVEITGDGTHFEAVIISEAFKNKSTLERHKIVYSALEEDMKENIHALSMKTLAPDELDKGV
ncbi:BolA/IbaG family iron-sulfur metabolism protein [bacterium]|jgi:acid stress-induced BolA-like protein IbaG/YrbA|nr:BolA/IbaG family iron-sulfur metabolism protein [bacterium]MBT3850211.1 BolA/IbaG family iron-sulfur metabolism protein [bacterium]MBT4435657.1 BolA/IbaG family iron-sulfur metabolism protein [bacterium]MDG2445295.1 BolA/IbaG family iron-sulfur metabolism protein [Thermodesulfobacteriota bacterium]NSW99640.1 BolA/IbaG family iron-sulfur metabolism protein [bacterium]|tara:strand:+ start:80 stop:316 length:237 start_codon:yes stop_codon:yes gene_type:complete